MDFGPVLLEVLTAAQTMYSDKRLKAAIGASVAKAHFVRDLLVRRPRSESTAWFWHVCTGFNDRFRDLGRIAARHLPHV